MSVARVDFYILETQSAATRLSFICKLIEKIYLSNHQLFVFCQEEKKAMELDASLWTFKPESFIPHSLENTKEAKVQISMAIPAPFYKDILLNESLVFPDFFTQFTRIIEIVHDDDTVKSLGRERYRAYKAKGCAIKSHQLHS